MPRVVRAHLVPGYARRVWCDTHMVTELVVDVYAVRDDQLKTGRGPTCVYTLRDHPQQQEQP